jgi:hypothetical protein
MDRTALRLVVTLEGPNVYLTCKGYRNAPCGQIVPRQDGWMVEGAGDTPERLFPSMQAAALYAAAEYASRIAE